MRVPHGLVLAALMAACAIPARADAPRPLELVGYVKLEKVTTTTAGERKVERFEPRVVVPGDRLIFGTRFVNNGAKTIERFVVSSPVPASVSLSAEADPSLQVSVDSGASWGRLGELEIVQPDGVRRAARSSDVTNIRWVLPTVAPGESGTLEFPVTVR